MLKYIVYGVIGFILLVLAASAGFHRRNKRLRLHLADKVIFKK
jgi:hypothetical protein